MGLRLQEKFATPFRNTNTILSDAKNVDNLMCCVVLLTAQTPQWLVLWAARLIPQPLVRASVALTGTRLVGLLLTVVRERIHTGSTTTFAEPATCGIARRQQ